ncbi:MAG TPA: hypothetical protein VKB46_03370 [Pyrinomonadaceae bacterium]|nr:hypothetical protein [Pyrinomonadaceae bacterium]
MGLEIQDKAKTVVTIEHLSRTIIRHSRFTLDLDLGPESEPSRKRRWFKLARATNGFCYLLYRLRPGKRKVRNSGALYKGEE